MQQSQQVIPWILSKYNVNIIINFRITNFWKVIKQGTWITTNAQSKFTFAKSEVLLLSMLVRNLTLILPDQLYDCSGEERLSRKCDPYLIAPTINLQAPRSLSLIRHRDEFTFLACGKSNLSHLSFWEFVTAFDTTTWVLIFISFYGSRLIIYNFTVRTGHPQLEAIYVRRFL